MKQMMNEVNPKAGALKQTNGKTLQNVSRKLVAFVLMIAITLQPAILSAKTLDINGDTCCSMDKKNSVSKFAKMVKLNLPSSEHLRKADSEITRNLYMSMDENRVKQFAEAFAAGDAEMTRAFYSESRISTPRAYYSEDEWMSTRFLAENIQVSKYDVRNDDLMNQAFSQSMKINWTVANSADMDQDVNLQFLAENISVPSAELISQADASMHARMIQELTNLTLAVK